MEAGRPGHCDHGSRAMPGMKGAWMPHKGIGSSEGHVGAWRCWGCSLSSELQEGYWCGPKEGGLGSRGQEACLRGQASWASTGQHAASFGPNTGRTPPTGQCLAAWRGSGFPGPRGLDKPPSASGLSFPKPQQRCDPSRLGGQEAENSKVRAQPPCREECPARLPWLHMLFSLLPLCLCSCCSLPGTPPSLQLISVQVSISFRPNPSAEVLIVLRAS